MQVHELPDLWLRLLIKEHLGPLERLQLFCSCHALAAAVLQHTACTLTLPGTSVRHQSSSSGSRHRTRCSAWLLPASLPEVARHAQHAQHVLHRLLADVKSLQVVFHGSISSRALALPMERVTCIQLQHCTVTAETMTSLRAFPTAHTLVLRPGCCSRLSAWDIATLAKFKSWLQPSLTRLVVHRGCGSSCIRAMAQLIGPQLTHYTSHCRDCFEQQYLHAFQRLSHLHTRWTIDNELLCTLQCLPHLNYVTAADVHFTHAVPCLCMPQYDTDSSCQHAAFAMC